MRRLVILFFCFSAITLHAQNATDTLQAFGASPDLYVYHTVQKGDTFFSLGRAYHISPKEIAVANHLTFNDPLHLFSVIKIPLTTENFLQQVPIASVQLTPVYHKVIKGETLYHVSVSYNKAPLNNMREWNHLTGNTVEIGQYLIVGWLKYNHSSSALKPTNNVTAATPVKEAVVKKYSDNNPSAEEKIVVVNKPVLTTENSNAAIVIPPPIITRADSGIVIPGNSNINNSSLTTATGSPFENDYLQETSVKDIAVQKGAGSWFPSNIPVGSKKYYALFNNAARGDIIKITNPLNGKFIYAKVLDAIPQLGANANIVVKISDAAKEDLGIEQERFYCEVNYAK